MAFRSCHFLSSGDDSGQTFFPYRNAKPSNMDFEKSSWNDAESRTLTFFLLHFVYHFIMEMDCGR